MLTISPPIVPYQRNRELQERHYSLKQTTKCRSNRLVGSRPCSRIAPSFDSVDTLHKTVPLRVRPGQPGLRFCRNPPGGRSGQLERVGLFICSSRTEKSIFSALSLARTTRKIQKKTNQCISNIPEFGLCRCMHDDPSSRLNWRRIRRRERGNGPSEKGTNLRHNCSCFEPFLCSPRTLSLDRWHRGELTYTKGRKI